MTLNEIRDFIFENYYKQTGFSEKKHLLLNETSEKKIYNCLQLNSQKIYMILVMLKNTVNHSKIEKHKITKTVKNNYSATKYF